MKKIFLLVACIFMISIFYWGVIGISDGMHKIKRSAFSIGCMDSGGPPAKCRELAGEYAKDSK